MEAFLYFLASTGITVVLAFKDEIRNTLKRRKRKGRHRKRRK
ncbi:hypothetical protein [Prescottella equi]|uniref:Uncharacterized protein n=1 Tax=Prescottella equi ATCC 33707 TaxID=525370 RepID=E9T051_RHOHA|nr:hypothetical protein [Prescottella equi]EGD24634.1 hypothetical protein HMPREF0724_11752 [Prescottella equi ATCC 33707]